MSGSTQDPQMIRELAALARLDLDPSERDRLGEQLRGILDYIETLQTVDVTGVPEYLSAQQPGAGLREDEPGPMLDLEAALSGVPQRRDGLVVVPKFKED